MVYTPGHAALMMSDNWQPQQMANVREMAGYYVAVRGRGRGQVRPSILGDGSYIFSNPVAVHRRSRAHLRP